MIYIILALILYTATTITGAYASRIANSNLVTAISNTVSAILPILISIPLLNNKTLVQSKMGILYAILTGLLIAGFTLALTKSFSINKVGIVTPIVFGGMIFLSTALSTVIFHEKISRLQSIGLFFLAIGFCVIIYARWVGK